MSFNTFRTKARAIELLGRKQVRDDITALTELIKNAFDADAELLVVDFVLDTDKPFLLIYENGHGMTKEELLNKWLVLGTDSKKKSKNEKRLTQKKKRPLMGEKGIGRLASAALGEQLWMFTKSLNENWHSLYLNWNVYENTDLFLDDVQIPFLENLSFSHVTRIEETNLKLKEMQIENLKNKSWFKDNLEVKPKFNELFYRIENQISKSVFPNEQVYQAIQWIDENFGEGTVLLIEDLRLRWKDVFQKSKKDKELDFMATQRYNRLGSFVDSFSNSLEDFTIEFLVDGEKQEFNYYIDESILNLYDVKIEGIIQGGKFYGKLYALNADEKIMEEVNNELGLGIDVTNGIVNPKAKDCGPIKVVFCHFEKDKKNSGLSEEEWNQLNEKVNIAGGISVIRDGIRVLPYGEPENDFLNLEQNRSKHAGKYLFSHRNMIGKIIINSEDNPNLEDKSSREGLIENEEFHYFFRTIQNLLVTIAVDYLSASRSGSKALRNSYVQYNQQMALKKKREDKAILNEKRELKTNIKELQNELKEKEQKLNNIRKQGILYNFPEISQEFNYDGILSNTTKFLIFKDKMLNELLKLKKNFHVYINTRFAPEIEENLILRINAHNKMKDIFFDNEIDEFTQKIKSIIRSNEEKLLNYKKMISSKTNSDIESIVDTRERRINVLFSQLKESVLEIEKQLDKKLNEKMSLSQEFGDFVKSLETIKVSNMNLLKNKMISINSKLKKASELLNTFKIMEINYIENESKNLDNLLNEIENEIGLFYSQNVLDFNNSIDQEIENTISKLTEFLLAEVNIFEHENDVIGLLKEENKNLKQENEILADLANLGMSAEVVNHEFNQLFINVSDGLSQLLNTNLSPVQKYWINQINLGFKSISTKHSQLSPMYRSNNLQKRQIKLFQIAEDLITFFSTRLEKNQIVIKNEISKDFIVNLSPSKFYPVLSNLLDNAIFWVLNKEEKIILLRSDKYQNSIFIEDNGPGIKEREKEKIFDPFYTKRNSGRGLGLTIVKKVLESQNHEIKVILNPDEKVLNGACFQVKFSEKEMV